MTSIEEAREIGARIAQAREEAGLTQVKLSEAIGLKPGDRTIQKYESGEIVPFGRMDKIAKATGVSKDWLIRGPVEQSQLDHIEAMLLRLVDELLSQPSEGAGGHGAESAVRPPPGIPPTDEETDGPQTGAAGQQ